VGLLLVLVSGCGGGSLLGAEDAPSFSSSANIQAALNDAGLTTGYEAVASADRDMYEQRAADVGKCEIDGEVPKLLIFKDKGQMDNWVGMVKQLGCKGLCRVGHSPVATTYIVVIRNAEGFTLRSTRN
jgi:hypothetical protein